jgi:hypothetical protein
MDPDPLTHLNQDPQPVCTSHTSLYYFFFSLTGIDLSMSAYGRVGVEPKSAEGRKALPFVKNGKESIVVNV